MLCPVLQVGPCWVPQRRLKPSEIDEIVGRLNVVKKAAKAIEEPPPPQAVGLAGFCVQCCLLHLALQQNMAGSHPQGCRLCICSAAALCLLQMRLSYKHDASKGSGFKAFQEVLVPVKKVSLDSIVEPHDQILATSIPSLSLQCVVA